MAGSATMHVPNHKQPQVRQQASRTGCIPTACEWLVRYQGVSGPLVDALQRTCDLDLNLRPGQDPRNNFGSVTAQVQQVLGASAPTFRIEGDRADNSLTGSQKVARIQKLLEVGKPCVIPFHGPGAWHALAVVGHDPDMDEFIVMLMDGNAPDDETRLPAACVRFQQDRRRGGQDLLFVDGAAIEENLRGLGYGE